jgi:DNA primase
MAVEEGRPRATDFYDDVVLPAVIERLDRVFPEFGWRRDSRGWVATDEEFTHRTFAARAERVVARPGHSGFLIHGGESMSWTAYLNGGVLPQGREFVRTVRELAARAGVDTAPIERSPPRDRRTDLLHDFFTLCRIELRGERGARARGYLEQRGLPADAVDGCGLGVVPAERDTKRLLEAGGYTELEIARSGVLADRRWPGRLCGAWRDEWRRIGTIWARSVDDRDTAQPRYLYLRGAARTNLPPYGFARRTQELVLVEGFLDYHQLAARGVDSVAALGGTSTSTRLFERLSRSGVETVVLSLDNDDAGRAATARAIEHSARASVSPAIYVVSSDAADAKDPDQLVRAEGVGAWRRRLDQRQCGIVWRAREMVGDVSPDAPEPRRRDVLRRVGAWLGSLPPRLALEQEDAVRAVAERCGYSAEAATRTFRAVYFRPPSREVEVADRVQMERRPEAGIEL